MTVHLDAGASAGAAPAVRDEARLRRTATALDAEFLTEMLKSAGLDKTLGGGIGEDQFSSLLVREQARILAESGGIGLAESIFRALAARATTGANDG